MRKVARLDGGATISPEVVRDLLWEAKLLSRASRLVSEKEARLAQRLEGTRNLFLIAQDVRPYFEKKQKALDALDAFSVAIREIELEEHKFLASAPEHFATIIRDRIGGIRGIQGVIEYLKKQDTLKIGIVAKRWEEYAPNILDALEEATQKKYGFKTTGPVGRFFEHVVPLVTGETVAAGTAAQYLGKLKRCNSGGSINST